MKSEAKSTRVLITVMTYPQPSAQYTEIICTAGVTSSGDWVRLYPIDYRYCDDTHKFRKYQWIDVDLYPNGARNDHRKESRRPRLETIRLVDKPLPTAKGWAAVLLSTRSLIAR